MIIDSLGTTVNSAIATKATIEERRLGAKKILFVFGRTLPSAWASKKTQEQRITLGGGRERERERGGGREREREREYIIFHCYTVINLSTYTYVGTQFNEDCKLDLNHTEDESIN